MGVVGQLAERVFVLTTESLYCFDREPRSAFDFNQNEAQAYPVDGFLRYAQNILHYTIQTYDSCTGISRMPYALQVRHDASKR